MGAENEGYVRFTTTVTVVILVRISSFKIVRVGLLDLSIGHIITETRIKLIEGLPLELIPLAGEVTGSCDGALQRGSPYGQWVVFALQNC